MIAKNKNRIRIRIKIKIKMMNKIKRMIKSKIYSILPKMNLKGTIIEELVKDSLICAVLKNYKAGEKGLLT